MIYINKNQPIFTAVQYNSSDIGPLKAMLLNLGHDLWTYFIYENDALYLIDITGTGKPIKISQGDFIYKKSDEQGYFVMGYIPFTENFQSINSIFETNPTGAIENSYLFNKIAGNFDEPNLETIVEPTPELNILEDRIAGIVDEKGNNITPENDALIFNEQPEDFGFVPDMPTMDETEKE